jgi:murein DD-endopeptidase MepM/ murein hydrolase activator NlpD
MRSALTFFWGFIAGMLFLLVLLWSHGSLHSVQVAAAPPVVTPGTASPPVATPPVAAPPATTYPPIPNSATAGGPPSLIVPVKGADSSQILDTFADTRGSGRHEAVDIMAPRSTPVLAAADGEVARLFHSKRGGTTVYQFDPTRTWCYYYAHLDRYAAGIAEGTALRQGQVLGYVGSTGDASATAPHLHFAIFRLGPEKHWWQGTPIDPYPILMRQARQ